MKDYPLTCHLFAWIRDESGNRMTICRRLELCVNNECIATFEATQPDFHYWTLGATCHVFHHRPLLSLANRMFNYTDHQQRPDGVDYFSTTKYDLVEMLRALRSSADWHLDAIGKEFLPLLDCPAYLAPMKLTEIMFQRIAS